MKLHQIGELSLLKEVRNRFKRADSHLIIGIGDDAAVIAPQEQKLIVTTDMMCEGIHFDMDLASPFHLGFKLVSVNVSDIMAMGGQPRFIFLGIAMGRDADADVFHGLYDGVAEAMELYGMELAGGDMCASRSDMVLSATVTGTGNNILTRAGARVGDKIYVTGYAGDSACGLELLRKLTKESKESVKNLRKKETRIPKHRNDTGKKSLMLQLIDSPVQIDLDTAIPLIIRHLMPVARDSSEIAINAGSMIDISDGLFLDLCRICDESGTGARVYLDKIPLSAEMKQVADKLNLDPLHLAASGGEDYELLFTAPAHASIPALIMEDEGGVKITCIGEITEKDRVVVDKYGREHELKASGYEHFGPSR